MEQNKKKAILVVSFGTSFAKTREKTIDRIEADIAAAYPDYTLYRAWTSKMIIAKLRRRDGIEVPTVEEAVEQMAADGVQELLVQCHPMLCDLLPLSLEEIFIYELGGVDYDIKNIVL